MSANTTYDLSSNIPASMNSQDDHKIQIGSTGIPLAFPIFAPTNNEGGLANGISHTVWTHYDSASQDALWGACHPPTPMPSSSRVDDGEYAILPPLYPIEIAIGAGNQTMYHGPEHLSPHYANSTTRFGYEYESSSGYTGLSLDNAAIQGSDRALPTRQYTASNRSAIEILDGTFDVNTIPQKHMVQNYQHTTKSNEQERSISRAGGHESNTNGFRIDGGPEQHIEKAIVRNPYLQDCLSWPERLVAAPKTSTPIPHTQTPHGRHFKCLLHLYGCATEFGSKNEWKRHIKTKHFKTEHWQCSGCSCSRFNSERGRSKTFNRKDLFKAHIKKKHWSDITTKQDELDMEEMTKDMVRDDCHKIRDPPLKATCSCSYAADGGPQTFSGDDALNQKLDHVSQHLEIPGQVEMYNMDDQYLRTWLVEHKILVNDKNGKLILAELIRQAKK